MTATADLTRGPALLAISISTELLALATCLVRFCLRKRAPSSRITSRNSRGLGLDDYAVAVAAMVSLVGTMFSVIEGSSMVDSAHALEFDWLGQPWYMMGTTFAKIAICLLFLRLVGDVQLWRILLSSQILLMAVLDFAFSLATNLQCRPLDKLWDPAVVGVCWDPSVRLNIGYFQGAFSVFWWLFLSLFPLMIVRDLEMHQTMRWPFYLLSSLSLIAAIFASVRTYETSLTVSGVYTFDTFFATVLSILEQNVGIVAANVLPMGSLCWKRQAAATQGRGRTAVRADPARSSRRDQQNPFESGAASVHSTASRRKTDDTEYDEYDLDDATNGLARQPSSHSSMKPSSILIIQAARAATTAKHKLKTKLVDTPLRTILNRAASLMSRAGRDADNHSGAESDADAAWPRGIIKTVEVDVVEEDIAAVLPAAHLQQNHRRLPSNASGIIITSDGVHGHGHGNHGRSMSRHSRMGSDNDWAALLRAGPTPPGSLRQGSRGPSRQGYN